MRALSAQPIEPEILIRDPRFSIKQSSIVTFAAVALLLFRNWAHLASGYPPVPRWFVVTVILVVLVPGMLPSLFHLPVWVRVGPHGVTMRRWFRAAHFQWAEIESFEVGNPSDWRAAYVIVRGPRAGIQSSIRLPGFRTIGPVELAEILRSNRRLYVSEAAEAMREQRRRTMD